MWRADLDVDETTLATLVATLSADERARADAVRDPVARRRFLADHGWRRRLLADRTGRPPAAIAYLVAPGGKPRLDPEGPHFSASRAGPTALYAVCDEAEVGVDVEAIGDREDRRERLAARLLAPGEQTAFEALPPSERTRALAACWARKEAHLKALGTGLVFPLTELELWTGDEVPVRVDGVETRSAAAGAGLAAAVAVRLADGQLADMPAVACPLAEG